MKFMGLVVERPRHIRVGLVSSVTKVELSVSDEGGCNTGGGVSLVVGSAGRAGENCCPIALRNLGATSPLDAEF